VNGVERGRVTSRLGKEKSHVPGRKEKKKYERVCEEKRQFATEADP